ncbi:MULTISPECIES: PaaI family thioesterase [Streptomyces]|uniref:Acyl-coenzyme A thioesterase THEM4 n=2 Tax=Streptomyces TaxID=1883 RepID=A0AAP6BD26_9ACTN|nr:MULTISPECIES: PaaI family thioesterase [Streptomyces]MBZ3910085.1 PaaI family thioesterase [Streptomyces acidiscabies]MDX2962439.1 PaaI family thioesterase [Streptomyces acidiscabies]MDX3020352.1 PaaI family thioesterase [Streptomyces acidiscabies]MDX3385519.1 PaaI family thioesterase [Streptomyces niveiscabiei]MDX3789820.1 PaaI family thioesterase [Streptomyces acidiscabies]
MTTATLAPLSPVLASDSPFVRRLRRMSGLKAIQESAAHGTGFFPFSDGLGVRVQMAERGRVILSATPTDGHSSWPGFTHGGFTATLCDTACALAALSTVRRGTKAVTGNFSMNLLQPVPAGSFRITCVGRATQTQGPRILAHADVTTPDGTLLAHSTALFLTKDLMA